MKKNKTVFVNEDASRLLDYFRSYKEIIGQSESQITNNVIAGSLDPVL
jgi:hypothetical protein